MKNQNTSRAVPILALLFISAALLWRAQARALNPLDDPFPSDPPTVTATGTLDATSTATATTNPFVTPAPSATLDLTASPTATVSPTPTATPTITATPTLSVTLTATPTATPTAYFSYLPALVDIPPPSPEGCVPLPSIPGYAPDTERELAHILNQYRLANGETALNIMPHLTQAARRHAWDMAFNEFTDHTGSDESSAGERAYDACYDWVNIGELIGINNSAEAMALAWINSAENRNLILSSDYLDFGTAYVYDAESLYEHYWVVVFGRPASAGVVAGEGE